MLKWALRVIHSALAFNIAWESALSVELSNSKKMSWLIKRSRFMTTPSAVTISSAGPSSIMACPVKILFTHIPGQRPFRQYPPGRAHGRSRVEDRFLAADGRQESKRCR